MVAQARRSGWASAPGSLAEVTKQASSHGLRQVANRRGDEPLSVLRPKTKDSAHPNSLSAQHGLGAQPLHTDGAHHPDPPEVVVLIAEKVNNTPTWLRQIGASDGRRPPWPSLRDGMFLVGTGPSSFFAPAWSRPGGLRYDPGCMSPCDARARVAAGFLADNSDAVAHHWSEAGRVLVIDNARALHGRAAVEAGSEDRELVRVAFSKVK